MIRTHDDDDDECGGDDDDDECGGGGGPLKSVINVKYKCSNSPSVSDPVFKYLRRISYAACMTRRTRQQHNL